MKFKIVFLIFIITNLCFAQFDEIMESDEIFIPEGIQLNKSNNIQQIQQTTGHFNALVLIVGFPDRDTTWPMISNNTNYPNEYFPKLGAYPDGTTLRDEIAINGPIPAADWYEATIESFFEIESSGNCTVDVIIPRMNSGSVPTTTRTFAEWIVENNNNPENVVWNQPDDMIGEALSNLLIEQPNILNDINMICAVFQGITKSEYHSQYTGRAFPWGTTISDPNTGSVLFDATNGTLNHQRIFSVVPHEILHIFGGALDPQGDFKGLPDRGTESYLAIDGHNNLTWGYDQMYHNGQFPALTSLYGQVPLSVYDKVYMGWIDSTEILEIKDIDKLNIKLYDVNNSLTSSELLDGYRVIKVFIEEDYIGTNDEYFLIEYRDGSGFDRNFYNSYEQEIFTGISIWHIKEDGVLNVLNDQLIDVEIPIPYNGWNGRTPQPDDGYYDETYERATDFNGNLSQEFDYLDDLHTGSSFITDGGIHFWEGRIHPDNPVQFIERTQPLKSNFYSNDLIQGKKSDKFTAITYPSTSNWIGENTFIAITDIKRNNGYMSLNVRFNYLEGVLEKDVTLSGNLTIGKDLTIPAGLTLSIEEGSEITFEGTAKLIVNGTLNAKGVSANRITFDRNGTTGKWGGIQFNSGSSGILEYCDIGNAIYGIYTNYADPIIENCNITGNNYGLYLRYSYTTPSWTSVDISDCNITNNTTYGLYIYSSSPTLSGNNISNNARGAVLYYSSNSIIEQSTFTNSTYYGLACYGSASPKLHYNSSYTYGGYNTITGNGAKGVRVTGSSNPNFGENSSSLGGYNSIYGNTGYEIENTTSITVKAQNNWWGTASGPQPGDLYGSVAAFIYLDYDPNGGQQKNIISDLPVYAYDKNSELPEDLQQASFKQSIAEFSTSVEMYKQHFIENTKSEFNTIAAVGYLNTLSYYLEPKTIVEEVEQTLGQELSTETIVELKSGLSVNLCLANKPNSAVSELDAALKLKIAEEDKNRLSAQKALILIYELNEEEKGKSILEEIKRNTKSDSPWNELASTELELLKGNENILPKQNVLNNIEENPSNYELFGNYPNPFNPSTTISYAIPFVSKVNMDIYDISGSLVKSFEVGSQSAGRHQIVWDGTNELGEKVSSGIYLYKFRAISYEGNGEVFEKTAKLLLMK